MFFADYKRRCVTEKYMSEMYLQVRDVIRFSYELYHDWQHSQKLRWQHQTIGSICQQSGKYLNNLKIFFLFAIFYFSPYQNCFKHAK